MDGIFLVIRWMTLFILFAVLLADVFLLYVGASLVRSDNVLLMEMLIGVFLYPSRISWIVGILLFLAGMYDIVFLSMKVAEPTAMEFTQAIDYYLIPWSLRKSFLGYVVRGVSVFFYPLMFILFLTTPWRRYYQWLN